MSLGGALVGSGFDAELDPLAGESVEQVVTVGLNEAAAAVSGRVAEDLPDRLGNSAPQSLSKGFIASYGLSDRADPRVSIAEIGWRLLRMEPTLRQPPRDVRVPEAVAQRPPRGAPATWGGRVAKAGGGLSRRRRGA